MERPLTGGMPSRPNHRRDNYAPIRSEPEEYYRRQGGDDSTDLDECCQSVMKLAFGRSSASRRDDDEPVGMGRLNRGRARRAGPLDETREKLYADIERLQRNISERNERNASRRERLERLKAQDDSEKWEDELYLARVQELKDAQTRIKTSSSISIQEVSERVWQLNEKISHSASEMIGARLSSVDHPELNVEDAIKKSLGKAFLFLFQSDAGSVLEDKQLAQAVLQIFLVRSCADFINHWALGHTRFNHGMNRLYNRILEKESQIVAGKWRQLALGKVPPGWSLDKYTNVKTEQALQILTCAGWSGSISQVQSLIKELMVMADELRKNVKLDMISSDLRPRVAMPREVYQPSTMKDVAHRFGMEKTITSERLHVLGSTSIGLEVHWKQYSMPRPAVRVVYQTKVLCIEPLRERLSGTKTPTPQSDSLPRRLSRGRSFSVS